MADEVLDLIRGGAEPPAPAYPSRSMAMSAGRKKAKKPEEEDEVLGLIQGTTAPESQVTQQAAAVQQKPPMVRQIIGNVLQKGFEAKAAIPAFSAAMLDIPASLPEFITSTISYPAARMAGGTDTQSREVAQTLSAPLSYLKPGKFTGLEKTPAYQQSLPAKTMEFIGGNIHKGVDWIAQKTGLSPNDVQGAVDVLMLATPKIVPQVAKTASKVGGVIKENLPTVTIERQPTTNVPKTGGLTSEQMQAQFEARGGNLKQNAEQLNQNYERQKANANIANDAESVQQPIFDTNGQVIGQADLGTAKPTRVDSEFKPVEYAESGLPLDEQFARAKAIERVFGTDYAADLAALEGKGKERATNYQASKSDTPLGNYLAEKFKDEQRRLQAFADQQAQRTGGIVGLDESAKFKRGEAILDPLKKLEDYFNKETKKIYAERDSQAANIPVESKNILNVLNDESLTLANSETIGLSKISMARMRQLNMIDKDGNLLPINAKTAENFRQFLNENYDRKNANLHRALKIAVDEDVLANLDTNSPIYKDARSLVELRKNTLDNPKGISSILDESGPNNINRKVDKEKISQNIANMSVEQFTHVIDTLKNMPPELRGAGNQALANIKSQFASNISALANKPKELTKFMNDNREVMPRLFSAEEMGNLRDLHNVSHIFKTDTGYPGAAVQKINVEQKLSGKIGQQILQKGSAAAAELATGGAGFGLPALAAHEIIGAKLEKSKQKKIAKAEEEAFKNAQSRFVPIKDLINKEK